MYVDYLSLTGFRSYAQLDVELKPGVTVFVGPNGTGKTNIVEAIGYLASLSSHRVSTDAPLLLLMPARRSSAPGSPEEPNTPASSWN